MIGIPLLVITFGNYNQAIGISSVIILWNRRLEVSIPYIMISSRNSLPVLCADGRTRWSP